MPQFQSVASVLRTTRLKVLAGFMMLTVIAAAGMAGVICWRVADRGIADSEARGLAQMQIGADAVARQTVISVKTLGDLQRLALVAAGLRALDQGPSYAIALGALRASMADSVLGVSELSVLDHGGAELLHEGGRHGLEPDAEQARGFGRPWKDKGGQIVLRWTSQPDASDGLVVQITLDPTALSNVIGVVLPDGMVAANRSIAGLMTMDDRRLVARSQMEPGRSLDENLQIRFPWMDDIVRQGFGSRRAMSMLYGYDMMVGYRTLPALGLIAASVSPADDMLALARVRAERWREAPFEGLAAGLVTVGLLLVWTERRRTQAKLTAEAHARALAVAGRAEIEALIRSSPAMLFRGRLDAQARYSVEYVTPNAQQIIGWEQDYLADVEALWRHAAPDALQARANNYATALREGRAVFEYHFARPDGEACWLRTEVVVVRRHGDGGADVVGSVINVTRERELAAQALIQNRMATVGEIATSIAHELSQPVTVIGMAASYAQTLAEPLGGASEVRRQIDTVLLQSRRAGEIIRQLRKYGHPDASGLGPVDLWQVVSGAMVLAGRRLSQASVAVEVDLPHDLPMVHGQLIQVEQVLMNLMLNARDAMMAMPAEQRRLLISAEIGDDVVIDVADSGPGVPAEFLERVFEPFFTTKEAGAGTGLGLSLCRTMMEGFGGTISVRNGEAGAVFSLRFRREVVLNEKRAAVRV